MASFVGYALRVWVAYLALLGALWLLGAEPARFVPVAVGLVVLAFGWYVFQRSVYAWRLRRAPILRHLTKGRRVRVVAGDFEGRDGYVVEVSLSGQASVVLVEPTPDELPHVSIEPAFLKLANQE